MELGLQNLWLFVVAGWALNITPGPDVFFITANSLRHGWRAGVVAVAGICSGCIVHVVAAALGVSALIAASATAFTVLKWVGAAYLMYVGFKMLTSKTPTLQTMDISTAPSTSVDYTAIYKQGFWTNVLNPKVALFFLAFLPQFIAPGSTHVNVSFLVLGLLFNLNSIPICLGYVFLGAWVHSHAGQLQRRMHWIERAAGAAFIGFGLKLALTKD